jgi:hypothetical protein
MPNEARHYFVYGNTAQGFISRLTTNLQGIDNVYIIRGQPETGKAGFMRLIADECQKTGLKLEYLHCPSAPDTCDGLIVPDLKLAVIDSTDLHYTRLITSAPAGEYIDTDSAFDSEKLRKAADTVTGLIQDITACHESAFRHFSSALAVHDDWEKIYIENMDFNALSSAVIDRILGDSRLPKTPVVKERFFGASTPSGAMDFIENLTGTISKRYLLKGRPGTGKSTLLRKVAAASAERGLDTEVYSCAFDSNSLDMLIWPELDTCLFDSTAPHLYEPSRPSDEVIDMYAGCVRPDTDKKYEKELADINQRYKKAVQNGTNYLAKAKEYLDELLGIYTDAADRGEILRLCAGVTEKLRSPAR